MLISYNWLKEFIPDLTETPAVIAEKLSRSLAEVEGVREYNHDRIFEIENKALGHRADLFGMVGLARETAAALRKTFVPPEINLLDPATGKLDTQTHIDIILPTSLEPPKPPLCSRYSAAIIHSVKVGPSPSWLQDRLRSVNLRPINNIVDVTNYLMYKYGQPLHAFDLAHLQPVPPNPPIPPLYIEVRLAQAGEILVLLDGTQITLTLNDLVIANNIGDKSTPIALAGIMGGKVSEINDQTTDILLESANFDMYAIRAGSRRHGVRSDASLRFEKGLDPELTFFVLQEAIQTIAGQAAPTGISDTYPSPIPPIPHIPFTLSQINHYLNTPLSLEETLSLLHRLDLQTETEGAETILVTPPSFRKDLNLTEDLYEEIGRLYDYNQIEPTLPTHTIQPPAENKLWTFKRRLRETLTRLGLTETLNYSFVDKVQAGWVVEVISDHQLGLAQKFDPAALALENPVAPEFAYLRSSLVPGLTANTTENAKRFDEFGLFEIGLVTHPHPDANKLPIEPEVLSLIFYSRRINTQDALVHTKSVWRTLLNLLNITNDLASLSPLEIKLGDIKGTAFGYEIDTATLYEAAQPPHFQPIPPSPPTIQDLSFIVDENQPVGDIIQEIENRVGEYLEKTELLDVFQNEKLQSEHKKSVTVRLTFQHPERSLADKEINPIRAEIERYLRDTYKAQIR